MIAIQIEDIKEFMNHLLKESTFDEFETLSVDLSTIIYFSIDGKIQSSFLDTSEKELYKEEYIKWAQLKTTVFQLLKGRKTPSFIKISFILSNKSKNLLIEKSKVPVQPNTIQGFTLNILYEHNELKLTTGTNYKTFTLDKSIEFYFDQSMKKFLKKHQVLFKELD